MSRKEKITTLVLLGILIAMILAFPWTAARWGCVPWTGAPRIEFDSELECWQWLARAKASNPAPELTCTRGLPGPSPAQMLWTRIHRAD